MDFQQEFMNALQIGTQHAKSILNNDNLPIPLSPIASLNGNIPYILGYGNILAVYPYHYEITKLNCFCILYTETGSGALQIEEDSYLLTPNTLALIDCKKKHRIEIRQSQWNYKIFFINGAMVALLYENITSYCGPLYHIAPGSSVPTMISRMYELSSKNGTSSFFHTKLLLDVLLEIMIEIEHKNNNSPRIPDYITQIRYNFDHKYQNSYSLVSLEKEYHVCKYRICREFKEIFHISPIQYLNLRRIDAVKEALLTTDKRVNEIGRMAGFENMNLFIRLFKKYTGVTPLNYRKQSPVSTYYH